MLLICWVFENPKPFLVEISPQKKIVGELKEAIVAKKPNCFRDIDADVLNLWKKIISEEDMDQLRLSDLKDEDKLCVTWKVGNYFKETPSEESIHIVIRLPEPLGGETSKLLSFIALISSVTTSHIS
jgi:Crinkler effector protein N-terminal domain